VTVPPTSSGVAAFFSPLGDHAVTITVGDSIDEATHRRVRAISAALDSHEIVGVVDQVPGFASLVVHYDPERVTGDEDEPPYERLVRSLTDLLAHVGDETLPPPRTKEIPVCYGGEFGPDLGDVARHTGFTEARVVELHAAAEYLVYFVGFSTCLPYLGGLPPELATPRLAAPRQHVPVGSVAIGGAQAGIYPLASPGGWRLIGRTHVRLFDPSASPPPLLRMGDRVRFIPVREVQP